MSTQLQLLQRIGPVSQKVISDLGLLAEFAGTWVGKGFNLIARPNKQGGSVFFLMLNGTSETLEFTPIGGAVPNRGSVQDDIFIHGLSYLQRVSDLDTYAPLHIEPGFWLHVPPTRDPLDPKDSYVRLSTIPHGDSLVAQSVFATEVKGPPVLAPVDALPFRIVPGTPIPGLNQVPNPDPITTLGYIDPYLNPKMPPSVTSPQPAAAIVHNPVLLLQDAIAHQTIERTVVIQVSSANHGGILNIPFVVKNANTVQMDSIFWIETVRTEQGTFQQLQYVQRVMLDFDGIHWPHVSVATLVKQ